MKKIIKRTTAYFLTIILLLNTLSPAGFAVSGGLAVLGAATIDCTPSVSYDAAKNEYSLHLELDAEFYEANRSTDNSVPARGYFSPNYTGWYLVELWGGSGADGLDDGSRKGGKGGEGGYVYAKVYLEKDQILYYSLGGNGTVGYETGAGGGANGGGGGGSAVTFGVGGGGGYSALFLFEDSAYFDDAYLDDQHNFVGENISEPDRNSKYLMIAGGGGGGGAGNGASLSGDNQLTANGGSGGNMNSSISGSVTGDGTVAGTFYAGGNGNSSGSSNSYIGKGGTTAPGAVESTIWNWSSGEKPNNWTGTHNTDTNGGSGGAGNLRGGGGGGGYCGGSGGVQQSLVTPVNVGGGGGGSSFVASSANNKAVVTAVTTAANPQPEDGLTPHELSLLDGLHTTPERSAVAITYLADEDQNFSNMGHLNVSFTLSKYFNVTGFGFTQSHVDTNYATGYNFSYTPKDNGETDVTLYDINLLPTEENLTGHLGIDIKFQPKNAFVGGNDVPLLADDTVTVTEASGNSPASCAISLSGDKNNCYVNVPLKFAVDTLNHNYNSPKTLTPSQLHGGYYTAIRENLSALFVYDFIDSISDYAIEGMPTNGMEVSQTTTFPVSITVTPKNDLNINSKAGPECGTTIFSSDSVVTILEQHQGHLNGVTMNYYKSLTYNGDGTYTYTLQTTASNDRLAHLPTPDTFDENASGGGEYTVQHDGIYLVQAWGGSGHKGQEASGLGGTGQGGTGGAGGYVYVYLPLRKGDKLILSPMGQLGAPPDATGSETGAAVGGGGGTYTSVRLDYDETAYTDSIVPADIPHLLIAGGGGGGGNAKVGAWIGLAVEHGGNGASSTEVSSYLLDDLSQYNGIAGKPGGLTSGILPVAGDGGAAAPSYYCGDAGIYRNYNAELLDKVSSEEFNAYISDRATPNAAGGGGAKVTCLQLTDHSHVATDLAGYELDLQFSKYFDIVENSLTGVNNGDAAAAAGMTDLVYTSSIDENLVKLTEIAPFQSQSSESTDETTIYNSSIDFTFTIKLKPKAEFLGGNDVPLITEAQMRHTLTHDGETHEATAHIMPDDKADYANVRLLLTDDVLGTLTGNDIHLEETSVRPVDQNELYSYTDGWSKPADDTAWTADFLESFVQLSLQSDPDTDVGAGPYTVDRNTHYYVTAGIESPGPRKASVGPVVSSLSQRVEANIFVRPRIVYILTDVTTSEKLGVDNCASMDPTVDYVAILTANPGYKLPESITVTYNDTDSPVPCSYDSSTGRFTVAAENIRSLTVEVSAVKQQYKINYAYEVPDSTEVATYTQTVFYGDPVTHWNFYGNNLTGYDFAWRWYTNHDIDSVAQDGDVPVTMPARDLWVIGNYSPKTYTLAVNYVYENGTQAADSVEATEFAFNTSYSFPSPAIVGYAADKPLLSGLVDEALVLGNTAGAAVNGNAVTFTVTYRATANQLLIHYIYEDTGVTEDFRTDTYKTGDSYTVDLTVPEGYTAYLDDIPVTKISGTMSAEGVVCYVYFRPNPILVTFYFDKENGGQCTEDSRVVLFNSTYNRCVENGKEVFLNLPTDVLRAGYAFKGWYLDPNDPTSEVTNETTVTSTQNHTLYARWEAKPSTLVVRHVYLNGTTAADTESFEVTFGQDYTVTAKNILGHSAHVKDGENYVKQDSITVTNMPAASVERTFYYIANEYTLTILYLYGDRGGNQPAAEPYVQQVPFGASYSVPSPNVTSGNTVYECNRTVVSGTMDSVGGKTERVYYYAKPPVISVTIDWGEMNFTYTRGRWNPETHQTDNGVFAPTSSDANIVTITNGKDSTVSVDVTLSYESSQDYQTVQGHFTAGPTAEEAITSMNVAKNTVVQAWFWLSGRMSDTFSGNDTVGKCTITLTGGG